MTRRGDATTPHRAASLALGLSPWADVRCVWLRVVGVSVQHPFSSAPSAAFSCPFPFQRSDPPPGPQESDQSHRATQIAPILVMLLTRMVFSVRKAALGTYSDESLRNLHCATEAVLLTWRTGQTTSVGAALGKLHMASARCRRSDWAIFWMRSAVRARLLVALPCVYMCAVC